MHMFCIPRVQENALSGVTLGAGLWELVFVNEALVLIYILLLKRYHLTTLSVPDENVQKVFM